MEVDGVARQKPHLPGNQIFPERLAAATEMSVHRTGVGTCHPLLQLASFKVSRERLRPATSGRIEPGSLDPPQK